MELSDCGVYNLVGGFNELRQQNQLCDIVITVGRRAFPAHKVVLAACSSYFRTMFTAEESSLSEISLDGDADVFEKLLEWFYTGKLVITAETVKAIGELAGVMQLNVVKKACSQFSKHKSVDSRYKDYEHSSDDEDAFFLKKVLFEGMVELWKQNQLCDIIINVEGRAFHAHKAVLAACSSYFLAMFSSGFREQSQREVTIDGNAEIFEALLDLRYEGNTYKTIKTDTACAILEMACYMQLTDIIMACSTFITCRYRYHYRYQPSDMMPIGDTFRVAQIAKSHDLTELTETAEKYMTRNISELKESGDLMQYGSPDFLHSFLKRQDLSSEDEEVEVLEMVVNWLKHDWMNRRIHALDLLQDVRLGFVSEADLKTLLSGEFLEIEGCKQLVERVLFWKHSGNSKEDLRRQAPQLFSTRSFITAPITCTRTGIDYYSEETSRWLSLPEFSNLPTGFTEPPDIPSLIVVNETLYAVGGLDHNDESDDESDDDEHVNPYCSNYNDYSHTCRYVFNRHFHRYDTLLNKWISLPQLKQPRKNTPLVYLDGFIYIFGGVDDTQGNQNVERFDMHKMQWQSLALLPLPYYDEGRWALTSAVVFQGMILVYWFRGSKKKCSHVIQEYLPSTNSWKRKLVKREPHGYDPDRQAPPALFVHNDKCYCLMYHIRDRYYGQYPSVRLLNFNTHKNEVKITIGEAVNQDLIPADEIGCYHKQGAFRIKEDVFMKTNGFVYKTDFKIGIDRSIDLNLSQDLKDWENFRVSSGAWVDAPCITYFSFDKKRLGDVYHG